MVSNCSKIILRRLEVYRDVFNYMNLRLIRMLLGELYLILLIYRIRIYHYVYTMTITSYMITLELVKLGLIIMLELHSYINRVRLVREFTRDLSMILVSSN